MPATTVLSNEYFDLLYHEGSKIVHIVQKPAMNDEQIKVLLTAGTDLLEKHGANK